MQTVELFCGTKSFSNIARDEGHATFTTDNDRRHNADLTKDVLTLEPGELPDADVLWASPPVKVSRWQLSGEIGTMIIRPSTRGRSSQ